MDNHVSLLLLFLSCLQIDLRLVSPDQPCLLSNVADLFRRGLLRILRGLLSARCLLPSVAATVATMVVVVVVEVEEEKELLSVGATHLAEEGSATAADGPS